PSPHRLVGDIQPTLSEQVFDVAIAECETQIEPNSVPDNRRRKLVAGKRDRHAPSYPPNGRPLSFAGWCGRRPRGIWVNEEACRKVVVKSNRRSVVHGKAYH